MPKQQSDRAERKQVRLCDITKQTDVFQFRHCIVDPHHVDELEKVLDNGNILDPLSLWLDPDTEKLVVVDGHHRLAAYKQYGWRRKVPALVFSCGIERARLIALRENGKARLPLSKDERTDAAWALVCLDLEDYSRRIIRENTGVGDGTVANMRRTYKALLKRDPESEMPRHWWQALQALKDGEQREYTEEEREAMIEAKAAQLDAEIGKALGFMAAHLPEAAVEVVVKRLGKKGLSLLLEEYGDIFDPYGLDDVEDEEE